ncbi:hypothetical protein GOP47_0002278 [Adiantum capillus-veneris]|uniref:Uncharacterized protein n=1 Tax=Adiantum capillus-veneris TaxID=13818 RepID=A0A9D4VAN5_ADICA|nr:hypothetical protein GOP47_0002278 [Adiantum capillus-veneris]
MAHSVLHPASQPSGLDRRPYPSLSSLFSSSSSLVSQSPFSLRLISAQQTQNICIEQSLILSHGAAILKNPLSPLRSWPLRRKASSQSFPQQSQSLSAGSFGGGYGPGGGERGGGGGCGDGYGRDDEEDGGHHASNEPWRFGLFSSLLDGWRERVHADSQFPFKILTEEIIGVAASVFGDMSCRPGFGLGELDFVFSNLIVCAIVNFALMYVLAPTSSVAAASGGLLPGMFASCPPGHMWEVGAYSFTQRAGTFVYKGALFATVGFGAGLVGTALSTVLLNARKKVDPSFSLQNSPPPTLLNACTWALQLGVSSNSRYQLLNGLEFALEGVMNPSLFKGLVFAVRSLNNVVGGMSFMMMTRLTGSQDRSKQLLEMQS